MASGFDSDLDVGVEDDRDLAHRGAGRLHLSVQLRELLQRVEDEREQAREGDQRADGQRALVVQARAEEERDPGRDHAEELDGGEEHRVQALGHEVGAPVLAVQHVERALELLLAVVRLHDGHAGDRLGDVCGHRGDAVAHVRERDLRPDLEPARQQQRGGHDHRRGEREPPVEDVQADDRGDQGQPVRDERGETLAEDVGERVDVARQARDDPARPLLGEVAERQPREVREQVLADVQDDALAEAREAERQVAARAPARRGSRRCRGRRRAAAASRRARSCRCRSRRGARASRRPGAAAARRGKREQDGTPALPPRVVRQAGEASAARWGGRR